MTRHKIRSVRDWMDAFSNIYSKADETRTPEQMWIAVMAHSSQIGESIRKFAFDDLIYHASHTFCWLCSFVNKCRSLQNDVFSINETLSGMIALKYPLVCGHCRKGVCECDPVQVEAPKDKAADYKELLNLRKGILKSFEDYPIEEYLNKFNIIYGGRIHIQTFDNIGFHFLEEVGEAAVYIRKLGQLRKITENASTEIDKTFLNELLTVEDIVDKYYSNYELIKKLDTSSSESNMLKARLVEAKMGLVVEIADSFSWFCAVLNKLNILSEFIRNEPNKIILQSIEEKLNEEYINSSTGESKCPSCQNKQCTCVFYNIGNGN